MVLRIIFNVFILLLPFAGRSQTVVSLHVDGPISPLTASFIHKGIEKAKTEKAECLLISLNTPGGLLKSTRAIVSDILSSTVPVVVFVFPEGAHAGSAGVFITLAAHVAAMAPGTNIGAAHPVNLDGKSDTIMNEKATNDAAAFIRSIAQKRSRNLDWSEEAVRKSISITGNEALEKNVIDLIANSELDLLEKLDGRTITLNSGSKVLNTNDARIVELEMTASEKILNLISDPSVAYILMLLGIYGILFELYSPGAIVPGVVGVISLILAFYSLHTLPVNYAGLALILFGIILFFLEIKIVSQGLLGLGGAIAMALGSVMLFEKSSSLEFIRISAGVIITATLFSALFFLVIISMGLKAQRAKPLSGEEGIIGETGESLSLLNPVGNVQVHGEIWNAESKTGIIKKGEKIKVTAIRNLTLFVEKLRNPEL
ncbi:NfeD family protein [Daejeonella oryzae]|uniref:NfeD family protein n=1 Tax=Daejeonella oryzae TaxID=1122943 RepID=UPI0003F78EBF|nr:nodulation protein NfeD [Daejeonella oryzae]